MNRRLSVIAAIAMVIAFCVFLSTRTIISQQASPPPASGNAEPVEIATSPKHREKADAGVSGSPSSPPALPSIKAPDLETAHADSPRSPAQPTTAKQAMIGSGTIAPNAPPSASDTAAGKELDQVRLMLRDYRTLYHENPVGTNAEIMKAVMGGNPKQAQLGPPEGQSLSADGQLLDRWGTPYFFHQLSADLMEIRSAGPDKILWTSDDIVTK